MQRVPDTALIVCAVLVELMQAHIEWYDKPVTVAGVICVGFRGYIMEGNVKTAETKPLPVVILSLQLLSFRS